VHQIVMTTPFDLAYQRAAKNVIAPYDPFTLPRVVPPSVSELSDRKYKSVDELMSETSDKSHKKDDGIQFGSSVYHMPDPGANHGVLGAVRGNHLAMAFARQPEHRLPKTAQEESDPWHVVDIADVVLAISQSNVGLVQPLFGDALRFDHLKRQQSDVNARVFREHLNFVVSKKKYDVNTVWDKAAKDREDHFLLHGVYEHEPLVLFRCDLSQPQEGRYDSYRGARESDCVQFAPEMCGGTTRPQVVAQQINDAFKEWEGACDIHVHCFSLLATCPIVLPTSEYPHDDVVFSEKVQFESAFPSIQFTVGGAGVSRSNWKGGRFPFVHIHYYHQCVEGAVSPEHAALSEVNEHLEAIEREQQERAQLRAQEVHQLLAKMSRPVEEYNRLSRYASDFVKAGDLMEGVTPFDATQREVLPVPITDDMFK
jgi:hypothetical protein